MAKAKNNDSGKLEKLALIADAVQETFKGKMTVIFELEEPEYKEMIGHFREIDRHFKHFSVDISGTEFHFILNEPEK
jgi:hypothetical protein